MKDPAYQAIALRPKGDLVRIERRIARGLPRFLLLWGLVFVFCALLNFLYRRIGWEGFDRDFGPSQMIWIALLQALLFIPGLVAYQVVMPRLGPTWTPWRRRAVAFVMAPVLIWLAPAVVSLGFLFWFGTSPFVASVAVGLVGPVPRR